jgi:hypothetical protein
LTVNAVFDDETARRSRAGGIGRRRSDQLGGNRLVAGCALATESDTCWIK